MANQTYKVPGTFEKCIHEHDAKLGHIKAKHPHGHYRCACPGCWDCSGRELDCTCDIDWDRLYGHG